MAVDHPDGYTEFHSFTTESESDHGLLEFENQEEEELLPFYGPITLSCHKW